MLPTHRSSSTIRTRAYKATAITAIWRRSCAIATNTRIRLYELCSARDRDVHATIDIRLQLKANEILKKRLEGANKKGALVVMNAQNGDILALVSWPLPTVDRPGDSGRIAGSGALWRVSTGLDVQTRHRDGSSEAEPESNGENIYVPRLGRRPRRNCNSGLAPSHPG